MNTRRVIGRVLGLAVVAGAVGVSAVVYRLQYVHPRTDDAYVRAKCREWLAQQGRSR